MAEAGTAQSLIAPRRYIQGRGVLASIDTSVAESVAVPVSASLAPRQPGAVRLGPWGIARRSVACSDDHCLSAATREELSDLKVFKVPQEAVVEDYSGDFGDVLESGQESIDVVHVGRHDAPADEHNRHTRLT